MRNNLRANYLKTSQPSGGKISCFVIGDLSLTQGCSKFLRESNHRLLGVITSNQELTNWALSEGIPAYDPEKDDILKALKAQEFDYLFSIVNMRIIPEEWISLPRLGAINFHDGPLPAYAGVHATSWALINGESTHGISWHYIDPLKIDGGDILVRKEIKVGNRETAHSLNVSCFEEASRSFPELISKLTSDNLQASRQDFSRRTYFGMYRRPEASAILTWQKTAFELANLVRGLEMGDGVPNPLGRARVLIGDTFYLCPRAEVVEQTDHTNFGTVTQADTNGICVSTSQNKLRILSLLSLDGQEISLDEVIKTHQLKIGCQLPTPTSECLNCREASAKNESFWVDRLAGLTPLSLPMMKTGSQGDQQTGEFITELPHRSASGSQIAVSFSIFLSRICNSEQFDIGIRLPKKLPSLVSQVVPFHVDLNHSETFEKTEENLLEELSETLQRGSFMYGVLARYPKLKHLGLSDLKNTLAIQVEIVDRLEQASKDDEFILRLIIPQEEGRLRLRYNSILVPETLIGTIMESFGAWLTGIARDPERVIGELPVMSPEVERKIIETWNDTAKTLPAERTIHELISSQASRCPKAVAMVCRDTQITFGDLDRRSNQLARHLKKSGVGPDILVGISMNRSVEMAVALLGILKAGGAYVPLDPSYPSERIALMLEDSAAPVLITERNLLSQLPDHQAKVICLDRDWPAIGKESTEFIPNEASPDNLAYVIYTSGSTGKPKGVMIEHRNAVNFFIGMDDKIAIDDDSSWLAVTSLSFDISVLEIFWTLARGIKTVIYPGAEFDDMPKSAPASTRKPIDFSFFYFASDQGEDPDDKYRLLMEGAKYADENGFSAVWTPERHFHDFGGLYPNPSVVGAALAVTTKNVQIRSGSVVAPLHSPIRIAEEWSVVDNLSGGRVGLSFASGWMPDDFVIKPETYANRKEIMLESIEQVQALWRGESVKFTGPLDKDVLVKTLPRPIQKELPVWVTTAGNPETYIMAAEAGANILTHLLGQSLAEVSEKIELYRKTWKECGHPGRGHVSLMLHTFVSDDPSYVKETVRGPMREYLRSSASLIRNYSTAFPVFKRLGQSADDVNFGDLDDDEMDALLDHAFDRYFETSGLFGTPDGAMEMVHQLKSNDIDEVACLLDFGINSDIVLENLHHLNQIRRASVTPAPPLDDISAEDITIPALVKRHGITHFQCTPSMASMILMDPDAKDALADLKCWMIGGEAFPVSLGKEIRGFCKGEVINMYGPTETTIWSTTHTLSVGDDEMIPIGRPIANTDIYILDQNQRAVPVGVPGELLIGGDGVVRGYHQRPDLTADRFIDYSPPGANQTKRIYRTGDLARYLPDGKIEFLGRMDHQVKIRGYRIELGEIEKRLAEHPQIRETVVIVREDNPGDKRLVAYIITQKNYGIETKELRQHLMDRVPEFMVPSHFVRLDAFEQTPNRKVDRKKLPAPGSDTERIETEFEPPATELEETLAELWKDVLGLPRIGRHSNFFDLGGHSLSAVQITSNIGKSFSVKFPLRAFMEDPLLSVVATKIERLVLDTMAQEDIEALLDQIEQSNDDVAP